MTPQNVFRRYPLFAALDGDVLDAWLAQGSEFALPAGETLFKAGTPGLWIYAVLEGRVRVLRPGTFRDVTLGASGPGEVLGEYALLPPGKNVSTCRMATAGRLFQLPLVYGRAMFAEQADFHRRLRRWVQLNALTAYLRNENFLGFMSAPSVLRFREHMHEIDFPDGASIQAEGLADDCWFFIQQGEVELVEDENGDGRLGPDGFFGEQALLPGGRVRHAIARGAARCLWLKRDDFFDAEPSREQSIRAAGEDQGFPWIGQEAVEDCGLASLAMIALFYGSPVTVRHLRGLARLDGRGASLGELVRLACELGLRAQAVEICGAQFDLVRTPAIVHYRGGHYVVLYRYAPGGVTLGDPACGIVRIAREAFHAQASGAVLALTAKF